MMPMLEYLEVLSEKFFRRNYFQICHLAFDYLKIVNVISNDENESHKAKTALVFVHLGFVPLS